MSKFGDILDGIAGEGLQRDIGKALFVAAQRVQVESQIYITTGAVSGANHVPSAPGEPPNNDTGGLVSSHETELVAWNHAKVSVRAPYAAALEFGASQNRLVQSGPYSGSIEIRLEARPYLGPAARSQREPMAKLVAKAVKQAVARAVKAAG